MSKNPFVSKILSLSLVLALLASTPVNVYASSVDEEAVAEATTIEESISEDSTDSNETVSEASTEGTSDPDEISDGDSAMNSDNETIEDGEAAEPEDIDDDSNEDSDETDEDCDHEYIVLTYSDDDIDVKITATKDVLGDIVGVEASAIDEGDEYSSIEASLAEDAENSGKSLLAFVAYDIRLVDVDGNEQEPDGTVSVQMTSKKTPESDESLDGANIGLVHFADSNDSTDMVELTGDDNTSIETNDSSDNVDVEFTTDSFSTYAVTWTNPSEDKKVGEITWIDSNGNKSRTAKIFIVDTDGNAIKSASGEIKENLTYGYGLDSLEIEATDGDRFATLAANKLTVSGYTYVGAYAKVSSIQQIGNLSYYSKQAGWCYYSVDNPNSSTWSQLNYKKDTINIFLTYKKNDQQDNIKYFTANLFNYERDYINSYNASLATDDQGVILFHNGGGNVAADLYTAYYNKPWNLCDTDGTSTGKPTSYQGIMQNTLSNNLPISNYALADLFNPNSTLFTEAIDSDTSISTDDTKAYTDVKIPFIIDSDGYYVLDTTQSYSNSYYTYTFNEESNELKVDTYGNYSNVGFWPFGTSDYHFGMDVSVNFNIGEDGKTDSGSDTVFEFAGDDDVWVYIGGKLALDMGGVHQTVKGKINFATGVCTVDYALVNGQKKEVTQNLYTDVLGYSSVEEGIKALSTSGSTLSIFYLERGGSASNCKIKFNFTDTSVDVPTDVTFNKVTSSGAALEGAEFALYAATDSECIGTALYTATSDSNGLVKFESVTAGTYYMKETESPDGYELPSTIYTVTVENGTSTMTGGKLTTTEGSHTIKNDGVTVNKIVNYLEHEKDPTEEITYDKTAEVNNWDERTYNITLSANGYTKIFEDATQIKASEIVLVLDATYSMYFPSDLVESSATHLDTESEYYFITQNTQATNYRVYYDSSDSQWKCIDASIHYVDGVQYGAGSSGTISETKNSDGSYTYKYTIGDTTATIGTFYTSPSGGDRTRLDELQEQTSYFIKEMYSLCGDKASIGIVYFNNNGSTSTNGYANAGILYDIKTLTEDSVNDMLTVINSPKSSSDKVTSLEDVMYSGTNQYLGMQQAEELLEKSDITDVAKYTLLITDGCPTVDKDSYSTANNIQTLKNTLENEDITLLSVGIDINTSAATSGAKSVLEAAASWYEQKYLTFSTTSTALETVFDQVIEIITNGKIKYEYKTATTITDVIDSRFEFVAVANSESADSYTVTENSDGTTTITWNNVEINNWSRTIIVKAKSDFMGGNVVTTNTADSGLVVDDSSYYFPEPTVNVKLLDMSLSGDEITILKNDTFSPSDVKKKLIEYFDSNVGFKISESDITELLSKGTVTVEYSYGSTDDNVGSFTFKLDASTGSPTGDNATATDIGYHKYEYTLKVVYEAYSYSDRLTTIVKEDSNKLAPVQKDIDSGYKLVATDDTDSRFTNKKSVNASYYVNVVDAGIYISKIGGATKSLLNGAKYTLSTDSTFKTGIIAENIESSTIDGTNGQMLFTGLGVGTYYLKETQAPTGYALSNEVFTIRITKADEAGSYKMTVSSPYDSTNSILPGETEFTVSNPLSNSDLTVIVKGIQLSVYDTVLYTLPETGGRGVYVYIIGGILLMLVGALLLYKNKKSNNK